MLVCLCLSSQDSDPILLIGEIEGGDGFGPKDSHWDMGHAHGDDAGRFW